MPTLDRRRLLIGSALVTAALACHAGPAAAQAEQQRLVDRARIVVDEFLADGNFQSMRVYVQNAYAVLIIPDLLKAGFVVGAEYGVGLLMARDLRSGSWSDPAFFDIYGGSVGLQIGGKTSDVMLTVMNQGALNKILSARFTLGTDASMAAGPVGMGVGAGTTVQFGEDTYVFSRGRGLWGGLAVEGSVVVPKQEWNTAYYGQSVPVTGILLERTVTNPGAGPLKDALTRF